MNVFTKTEYLDEKEKEQVRADSRKEKLIASTKVINGPPFPLPKDKHPYIKSVLYDNNDIGDYCEATEMLTLRFMSLELRQKFAEKEKFVPGISAYVSSIYELAQKAHTDNMAASASTFEVNESRLKTREETLAQVEGWLQESAKDKQLSGQPKRHGKFDPCDYSTWPCLGPPDAERSKDNLLPKIAQYKKSKNLNLAAIDKLNADKIPLEAELTALHAKLDVDDISEQEYKNLKDAIDYPQSRVDKFNNKITLLENEVANFETEISVNESKVTVLNMVLDAHQLRIDLDNFQKRRARTLERITKTLREMSKLENLKNNLNDAWLDATGDDEDLCEPLNLKAASEIYFI